METKDISFHDNLLHETHGAYNHKPTKHIKTRVTRMILQDDATTRSQMSREFIVKGSSIGDTSSTSIILDGSFRCFFMI